MRATEVDFLESSFHSSSSGNKLKAPFLYTFSPRSMTSASVSIPFPFMYLEAILSHSEIGIRSQGFSSLSWPIASEKDILFSKAPCTESSTATASLLLSLYKNLLLYPFAPFPFLRCKSNIARGTKRQLSLSPRTYSRRKRRRRRVFSGIEGATGLVFCTETMFPPEIFLYFSHSQGGSFSQNFLHFWALEMWPVQDLFSLLALDI